MPPLTASTVDHLDENAPPPASAAWSESELPAIAGYRIVRVLGRGGMGVVYEGEEEALRRKVALKVILAGAHAGEQERARFRAEALAAARLKHPNLVEIYRVGEDRGFPYLALEFVEGGSLARRLDKRPQPPAETARVVEVLARAMQHAHDSGVIHRDLKPANILLTADGVLKVADFGLAKRQDASLATATGHVLGTPPYMPPEQVRGDATLDHRADVYALGAVLYEMLTGRPPFDASDTADTLVQVLTQEPVPPTRLQPKVPRDLETVCLKCLEKEPKKRYASALELAEDLRRFRAGEPIAARPVGALGRGWRWCRRKPGLAAALAAAAVLLLATAAVSTWFALYQTEAADRLAAEQQATRSALDKAEANFRKLQEVMSALLKIRNLADVQGDINRPGQEAPALREAVKGLKALIRQNSDVYQFQHDLATVYGRLGNLENRSGRFDESLVSLEASRDLYQRLVAEHPKTAAFQSGLGKAWHNLGAVYRGLYQPVKARHCYEQACQVHGKLVEEHAGNLIYRSDLASSYNNLGNVEDATGRPEQALRAYEKARDLQEQLVVAHRGQPSFRSELGVTWSNLGGALANAAVAPNLPAGRHAELVRLAFAAFQKAHDLHSELVRDHPREPLYERELSRTLFNRGILQAELGQLEVAQKSFEQARARQAQLAKRYPEWPEHRVDLAKSCYNLGGVLRRQGRTAEAITELAKACALEEKLVAEFPQAVERQVAWGMSCNNLGALYSSDGKLDQGLRYCEKAIRIRKGLVDRVPDNLSWRHALAKSLGNAGLDLAELNRPAEAALRFRQAVEHERFVFDKAPHVPAYREELSKLYVTLGQLERTLARPEPAVAAAQAYQELWPHDADKLYAAGREMALCIPLVAPGVADPNAAQRARQRRYGDLAIKALRQSVREGYSNAAVMRADAILAPLRSRADFQQLLKGLSERQDPPAR